MYRAYLQTKGIVEEVLKRHPETRNSDRQLCIRVFEQLGLNLTPEQKSIFLKIPVNFASIGRSRRKIQNDEGRYQANEEVIKARRQERISIHDALSSEEEKLKKLSRECL
jgi:hypothetical protein